MKAINEFLDFLEDNEIYSNQVIPTDEEGNEDWGDTSVEDFTPNIQNGLNGIYDPHEFYSLCKSKFDSFKLEVLSINYKEHTQLRTEILKQLNGRLESISMLRLTSVYLLGDTYFRQMVETKILDCEEAIKSIPSDTNPSDTNPSDTNPSDTNPSDTNPSDTNQRINKIPPPHKNSLSKVQMDILIYYLKKYKIVNPDLKAKEQLAPCFSILTGFSAEQLRKGISSSKGFIQDGKGSIDWNPTELDFKKIKGLLKNIIIELEEESAKFKS